MLILGIETSCDETAASIVRNGVEILSNVVSSSLRFHKRFGGVVPEIATRHHTENIDKVVLSSLDDAGLQLKDIDVVSVTQGPGLVGALLIGISCAKSIAYTLNVPIIAVDHVRAHIYSALMGKERPDFPFIGLVISGGHTRLYLVGDFDKFKVLGDTLDDAIGEAYDKVAKILGLGYPGGPIIDRLAKKGNASAIKFTCKGVNGSLDFSFSGIKTAVLYCIRNQKPHTTHFPRLRREASVRVRGKPENRNQKRDILASFQEAALNVIVENSIKAMERYKINTLVIGGGVSANSRVREKMERESRYRNFKLYFPDLALCSDNAAMVAGLGYQLYKKGIRSGLDITAIT